MIALCAQSFTLTAGIRRRLQEQYQVVRWTEYLCVLPSKIVNRKHQMNDQPQIQAATLSIKHRRVIAIWLTVSLAACIAILTLMPLSTPQAIPGTDKIHHIIAFIALTLPCAAFYPKALFKVVVAAVVYGALIEVLQPYIGRSGELTDFLADLVGIGIGVSLGFLLNIVLKSSAILNPLRR